MNLSTIKGFDARAIFFSVNTHLHFIAVHLLFAFKNKPCLNISIFQLIKSLLYISHTLVRTIFDFFHINQLRDILLHRHDILAY